MLGAVVSPTDPGRRHLDRRQARGPAAGRVDRGGGEPRQRRNRPRDLQVRRRGGGHRQLLAGRRRVRLRRERAGRARGGARDRLDRDVGPPPPRRPDDRDRDLPDDRVLRLPAGGRARRVGRRRRGHGRHLPGLARARAGVAGHAVADALRSGRSWSSSSTRCCSRCSGCSSRASSTRSRASRRPS